MTTTPPKAALPVGLTIPDGFVHQHVRHELHEDIPVTVTRYQAAPELNYGGEHVTTVIGTDNGILYGYTRQLATRDESALPDTETARTIAFDLLKTVDTDYMAGLRELWIDRHDEQITTTGGQPATVAGIKVKTGHDNGLYAWVIVGEHGQVLTYERDIAWISAEARRHTHMWLHDEWITAHDAGSPELDPPLAHLAPPGGAPASGNPRPVSPPPPRPIPYIDGERPISNTIAEKEQSASTKSPLEDQTRPATAVVVGDRFHGFTIKKNVATVSQLLASLQTRSLDRIPHRVVVGQGVTDSDRQAVETEYTRQGLDAPEFLIETGTALATRAEAHKHRDRNVLIADLERTNDYSCQASLNVHNDNELLLDHQTGLHVQGMACVEAARQMFLAAITRLGLIDDLDRPYFVINSMATTFLSFLFPLPAQIEFTTAAPDRSRSGSAKFAATIRIHQAGKIASTTEVDFTVFAGDRISGIEHRKADKALTAMLTRLPEEA